RLVSISDRKRLATHPAFTTRGQLSPEEMVTSGISEDTVQLCADIQHIDDLLVDPEQALAAM
ncbi:MAG: PLP-dependent transferase, partial [Aquabacterium sp.]|nr:PLP-dependent transferase [Aquabacterium sp.]